MPEPELKDPPARDEAGQRRELEQGRLRASLGRGDGRMQSAGRTMETAGRGARAAGQGMEMAGRGAEMAGRGVQTAGKAVSTAGQGMMRGGAALSSTGLGAIAGVPLAIAGGAVAGAGAGMQGAGAAASATGKGVSSAGRATRSLGSGLTGTGGMMSKMGGGVGGAMAQNFASQVMRPGGGAPPGVGLARNAFTKGLSKTGPAGEIGASASRAGTAIQKCVKVLEARKVMWLEIVNSYCLDIITTMVIMGHKIVTDKDIRAAATAVKATVSSAQRAVPGSDKSGGGGSPASGLPSIPKLAKWAIDRVETILKAEWMLALILLTLQTLVITIAFISMAMVVFCMTPGGAAYCLYQAAKSAAS